MERSSGPTLVEGREASAEDVIEAAEEVRFLELDDVAGLLDDAPERLVALRIGADGAERIGALGVEAAMAARMDFGARGGERGGESFADCGVGLEKKERVALRAARADGGELAQGFDEFGEGGRVVGHGNIIWVSEQASCLGAVEGSLTIPSARWKSKIIRGHSTSSG